MVCKLCQNNQYNIDYKDAKKLRDFVNSQYQIKKSKHTILCKKHQRRIAQSIKRARFMALLPYTRDQLRLGR